MSKTNEDRLDNLFQILQAELEPHESDFSASRQLLRMRKRARYIKNELNVIALNNFIDLNEKVGNTVIDLPTDIIENAKYYITVIFERFNSRVREHNIQVPFDELYFEDLWKFGPGASYGVQGTHTADKIYQDMTCTSSAIPLVVNLRRRNFYFQAFDAIGNGGVRLVNGSKLATVPKNEDTVRTIAIEPSGNMCLQLAAGTYISDVLRFIGLDITKQQDKNKVLAELASISNGLATIDLKSASDMFTPELVRLLLPTQWYELLMKIRSSHTEINGELVELNMISTMGNGFTFPLMTLILSSLIYAYRCRENGPVLFIDWTHTGVYGDDIIISSSEYHGFCDILSRAGLIVNHDKSYSDGPFRESCGGDYYLGRDVTPFYITSILTDSELFVATNQVLEWSGRNSIFLPKTIQYLASLMNKVFLVPEWSNPDQGIKTTQVPTRYKFLFPVNPRKKLVNEFFLCPLAIGGYIESDGPDAYYTPRQYKTRYVVRRGRIPKGFLSGRDPLSRISSTSVKIDLYVSILFSEATLQYLK